jgi:hypothetical protein
LAGFRAMMARSVGWALAAGGRVQQSEQTVLTDRGSDCRFLNEVITTGPVDRRLLGDALVRRDLAYGVLGGMTPNERRKLLLHQDAGATAARTRGAA